MQMFAPYLTQILSSAVEAEARALKSGRRTAARGADRGDIRMVFNRDRRSALLANELLDPLPEPTFGTPNEPDPTA